MTKIESANARGFLCKLIRYMDNLAGLNVTIADLHQVWQDGAREAILGLTDGMCKTCGQTLPTSMESRSG